MLKSIMPDDSLHAAITQQIEHRMRSFEQAERSLDVQRLIEHFVSDPKAYMYSDGKRLSFEVMVIGLRSTFPKLRSIEGGFHNVHVVVLAPDAALATAEFHSDVTHLNGEETAQYGAATWLWRLIEGEWRITYGQVDHFAETRV